MLYTRRMDADEIRTQLAEHGQARADAIRARTDETASIKALVRPALDAGLGKSEVARLAQISRPALDAMLND